jgi:2-amino-4-hydroxy-6-hydroxymethyldihydropteridine diphosphokinase
MSHTVYLALGGNLGDRAANLRYSLRALPPDVEVEAVSALYETDPVGVTDQPAFLNAVCKASTALPPQALLDRVKGIEWASGRRPRRVWGPRPLDIDILLYDDQIVDSPVLQIPHPRLGERAFVLCPLADLAPDLIVPGLGQTVRTLLGSAEKAGVQRIAEPGWDTNGN